ncbi:MAG TPA: glycoside hydrolase family 3 N-terminal domain-containing protein, partial [Ilumatobacteraceae bacterium]|nr:glycoside hydrolase family 3 N-terminal domain-containing protein [Ilumatobacteraceae bacterium]
MTTPTPTGSVPLYRDASRSIPERVDDLLGRMTTVEKAAQLGSAWVFQLAAGTALTPAAAALMEHGLGQVTRVSGASNVVAADAARVANEIQRHLLEETRLGVPAIVHEEVCAGLMARGATVFSQPIGLASTWDPSLIERMAAVVRAEMRAIGAHQGLSPVLDVCRDPRWGRIEETFGEDPHLVAMMGNAFVRGLQGPTLDDGVVATAKHFVGYGASQGGLNWAPAHIPARELREVYLHPFEAAVRTAGLRSVMNAYNELDGIPCGASHELLTGILRDEWGFDGYVVADYFAVRQLESYHHLAADSPEAASMALSAGLDVELPMTDCYGESLVDAVDAGIVGTEILDRAVERVLRTKFELGLFECPFVDVAAATAAVGAAAGREFARVLASQSIVLLRNDGTLPIAPTTTATIAVIGPNADDPRNLFGDYSYAAHVESLLETRDSDNVFNIPLPDDLDLDVDIVGERTVFRAIVAAFPAADVRTTQGCSVNGPDRAGFAEAVRLAAASDIAVMVMGDKAGLTADSTCGESRDRSSLDLPGAQEELLRAVLATGTPVVLVLVAGRPSGSVDAHERCAAVVAAWLPGDEGAAAIADVLSGAVNPGAKLPVSVPRSAGHIPVYYRQKRSGGRSHWKGDYVDAAVSPLYSFGHGLSYTSFELAASNPTPATVGHDGEVTVTATLTNTGSRDGDEVVQLYTRDPRASVTRPVLELKAFARLSVA